MCVYTSRRKNADIENSFFIGRVKPSVFSYTVAMELKKELIAFRRFLHTNAEVGFAVEKTRAFIEENLRKMGYAPQKCGRAGILATVGKGKRKALLRADIDGLPIKEKTGLPFACTNGNMHACGHDMHTAMLLGAAKLLKEREEELNGEIRLLFQPAEELLEGAKNCIEDGVLDGVQAACMLHVLTALELPMSAVIVSSEGVSAPAADFFEIEVLGKGAHGSAPWKGADALSVAARILLGLEEISAREISPAAPFVLTFGALQAGEAQNVLSDRAVLKGTLRAFDEGTRLFVKKRMAQIAEYTAKAFRCKAKVVYKSGCPALVNDGEVSLIAERVAKSLVEGKLAFTSNALQGDTKKNSGGSEDFAYIAQAVPSVMIGLAAGEKKKGYVYPLHHPKADFDEGVLPLGAALYADMGRALLNFYGERPPKSEENAP